MRFLFLTIKFLPYWSIPLGLTFFEMAFIFRRRGNKPMRNRMLVIGSFFFLLTIAFFAFRWDTTAYPWLRSYLRVE